MKKTIVVLLYIGFWACYLVLAMVILGILYGSKENVQEEEIANAFRIILFFALVPSAISFNAFYFWLFPKYLLQKKYLQSAVYGWGISLIAGFVGYGLLTATYGQNCGVEEEDSLIGIVLFIAFVALICGVIAWVIRGFIIWLEEIKLKETLKQKNQEMELALVKAQLDPHFLFNTINNIDVLILKDADQASDYLNKLSDIMRFMLYETKTEEIPLTKELEYIKKYVELQKIRTSNASYVNLNIIGSAKNKVIAPMIFIPFIENAFKHTNNKKLENAIDIHVFIEGKTIALKCQNKFDPNRKRAGDTNSKGLGMELIQKRLHLIYPNRHTLRVETHDNLYRVNLTIENE